MKVGTKSILFGVHQFLWHPLTVARAWRHIYGSWPNWKEWIAIFCHDVGYWGSADMDGIEGKTHPIRGALIASRIVGFFDDHPLDYCIHTYYLALCHSRDMAKLEGEPVSKLYAADKVSVLFDPRWFYLLRARLSGEIAEYQRNSSLPDGTTPGQWFDWYRDKIRTRPGVKELL